MIGYQSRIARSHCLPSKLLSHRRATKPLFLPPELPCRHRLLSICASPSSWGRPSLLIRTRLTEREHGHRKARRNHRSPHKMLLVTFFDELAGRPVRREARIDSDGLFLTTSAYAGGRVGCADMSGGPIGAA